MDAALLKHFYEYFLPYPISAVTNPQTPLLLSVKLQAEYLGLSLKKIYFYLFFYFFLSLLHKRKKEKKKEVLDLYLTKYGYLLATRCIVSGLFDT